MNLARIPQGGRNWEAFGADPFLVGVAAYETVLGMQSAGVQAIAKQLCNKWGNAFCLSTHALTTEIRNSEQENNRELANAIVDDRTQHEIYFAPFLRSVMAGVASVMCAYNPVNGTYSCENSYLMNDFLKKELGFQGFVMTDWNAQHSTMDAMAGLDMSMPGDITTVSGTSYWGPNLTAYVLNGTIPEARLDDMATRILASWYFLGQDSPDYPKTNFNRFYPLDPATNAHVDVQGNHSLLVRELDAASIVLLKNVNGALPLNLRKPRKLVLIGSDAAPAHIAGANEFIGETGIDGVLAMGWGSG